MDSELATARESWRGASYDEVVTAWGLPARGAQDTYSWTSVDRPPPAQRSGSGTGGMLFGGAPEGAAVRCERTLVFRQGRVIDQDWSGDREFCKRFVRR